MQINSPTKINVKNYIQGNNLHAPYIQDVESLCAACEVNDYECVLNIIEDVIQNGNGNNNEERKVIIPSTLKKLNIDELNFLNAVSSIGASAIHEACRENAIECVEILIKYGANVNRRCARGRTPLHVACYKGNTEIVRMLLNEKTCDSTILDNSGSSVLHYAVIGKSYSSVLLLLLASVPQLLDNNGRSPLQICRTQAIQDLLNPSATPSINKILNFKNIHKHLDQDVQDQIVKVTSYMEHVYHRSTRFDFLKAVERRFQHLEDGRWYEVDDEEELIGKTIELLRLDWKFENATIVSYDHHNETWGIHLNEHRLYGVLTKEDVFFKPGWYDYMWFIMFQHFALTNRLQIGKIKVSGKKQDLILANNNLEKNMIFLMTLNDEHDEDRIKSKQQKKKSEIFQLILSFIGGIMRYEKESKATELNL